MLNVCLTFDYELFLGTNKASYEDILFLPTDRLIDLFVQTNTPATFFVDICCYSFFQKNGDDAFCRRMAAQLQTMSSSGLDVEFHLHPNWLISEMTDGGLKISPYQYRIHEFGFGKDGKAESIIKEQVGTLTSIVRQTKPDYRCVAYRAGGFCLQPEQELLTVLRDQGILIDSSVSPRLHCQDNGDGHYFDYRRVPKKQLNWWIDPKKGTDYDACTPQSLFEVPVTTFKASPSLLFGKTRKDITLPPSHPKGTYVSVPNAKKPGTLKKLWDKTIGRIVHYRTLSLDTQKASFIHAVLDTLYKQYRCGQNDAYVTVICHPKLLDDVRINNIAELIRLINNDSQRMRLMSLDQVANVVGNFNE